MTAFATDERRALPGDAAATLTATASEGTRRFDLEVASRADLARVWLHDGEATDDATRLALIAERIVAADADEEP